MEEDGRALAFPTQAESANPEAGFHSSGPKKLSSHLVTDSAWHEVLFVRELAHPFHIHLLAIIQTCPHLSKVVQSHACVEPLKVEKQLSMLHIE